MLYSRWCLYLGMQLNLQGTIPACLCIGCSWMYRLIVASSYGSQQFVTGGLYQIKEQCDRLILGSPYIHVLCMLSIIIRSQAICQFLYRYPIFIDATAAVAEKKGNRFLAQWADIMTGRIPKANLLRPEFSLTVGFQALLLFYKKMFKGGYGKKSKLL